MPRIPVFKPGSHTSSGGVVWDFGDADIREFVDGYDPGLHEAPVVVGHPASDDPAYGWVRGFEYDGGVVWADIDVVSPGFAGLVKDGYFRYVSLALYPRGDPNNPTPGRFYPRHVGYLGASPPAIKGLGSAEFSEWREAFCLPGQPCQPCGCSQEVSFGEVELSEVLMAEATAKQVQAAMVLLQAKEAEIKSREDALAARLVEDGKKDNLAFAESMVEEGKILPGHKEGLVELLSLIPQGGKIEFSEDGKTVSEDAGEFLRGLVASSPVRVEFDEVSGADKGRVRNRTVTMPAGMRADAESLELHAKALAYAEDNKCDYVTAVTAVTAVS